MKLKKKRAALKNMASYCSGFPFWAQFHLYFIRICGPRRAFSTAPRTPYPASPFLIILSFFVSSIYFFFFFFFYFLIIFFILSDPTNYSDSFLPKYRIHDIRLVYFPSKPKSHSIHTGGISWPTASTERQLGHLSVE